MDSPTGSDTTNWAQPIGAAALAASPLLLLGQYLGNVPDQTILFTVAYATLFGICLWLAPPRRAPRSSSAFSGPALLIRLGALLGLALIAVLYSGIQYQDLAILPLENLSTQIALGAAAAALLIAGLFPTLPTGYLLAGVVVTGLILRGIGLEVWAIEPSTRDMLALVESAQQRLLAGENPYGIHTMQRGSEVPLTYLPGLWLGYLPPRLLDLDIRWMGVIADLCIVGSLWWAARGVAPQRRRWAEAGVFLIACGWLFLPTVHWNGIYAEPHVWWAVLAILMGAVARDRWWIAAVALGVTVATRHYGVIVLPFVLLAMVRRLGWRAMLPRLAVCGTVTALLVVPFVAADPDTFWFGTLRWLQEYGPAHEKWFHAKLGFAGYFYKHDLDGWLPLIQFTGVAATFLAALAARRASSQRIFAFAGTAYIWFVMFNGIIWFSFYLGAFLFVAFSLVSPRSELAPDRVEAPGDRRLAIAAVVVAAALTAGGWLGWTLLRSLSPPGLDETRAHLRERIKPGDALLDRSDWHLAFIEGSEVSDETEPPEGVEIGHGLFEGFHGRIGALANDRIWAVARPGRNGDWIDRVAGLGNVLERRQFGRYQVIGVDPPDRTESLIGSLEDLTVSYRSSDGKRVTADKRGDGRPVWQAKNAPSWAKVRPKTCTHGGMARRGVYAHPTDDGELTLTWEDVRLGSTLVVRAGLEDDIVVWERGDVTVEVRIDGRAEAPLMVRNRRGIQWRAYDTSTFAGKRADVAMTITTDKAAQRWFCLDAIVMG
ncbi:MAG: hypothetical protein ABEN55_05925, partial [Bradymonadaceae bacterium]